MEALAVADVVAVAELLVAEDVAVGVDYALRQPRGARGVIELCRVIRERVDGVELRGHAGQRVLVEDQQLGAAQVREAPRVLGVGHQHARLRVADAVLDALVPIQDGH